MNDSSIKTWFSRRGFKPAGYGSNSRNWFSKNRACRWKGRLFRIRKVDGQWQVDVSEPIAQFDRWANSTERTVALKCFMHHVSNKSLDVLLRGDAS